ncbi:MAG: hypothetical protein NZ956_01420, partial [Candidatus Caldarchaeum sp.]|nr:hypothetical protein [Candidatus Caldarchaeum sp.]
GEKTEEGTTLGQAVYNIEAASALYTMTFNLDISGIGVPSTQFGEKHPEEKELEAQAPRRRTAALKALSAFMSQISFGGKHSRYLPNAELMSCVLALSDMPFTVTPGNFRNYVERTSVKLKKLSSIFNVGGRVWAVVKEKNVTVPSEVKIVENAEDIVAELLENLRQKNIVA